MGFFELAGAGPLMTSLFPADSDFGDTAAKAVVWEEWADFAHQAKGFEEAGKAFATAAYGGNPAAIGAAMHELGKTCKACHKKFRTKR